MNPIRELPLTLGFLVLLWAIGVATGSLLNGPETALMEQVGLILHGGSGAWWP